MPDIFVSYARDERARAALIKEKLEALGLRVFFDIEGGIDAGDAFPQRITDGIRNSRSVLACWSKIALTRDWVRRECMMARDTGKLVAVAIDTILPSDLPAEFYDVSFEDLSNFTGQERHWGWSQTLASIARRLDAWVDANPGDPEAEATLDLSSSLRKAALVAREDAPQPTGAMLQSTSAASALWEKVRGSCDEGELRRFADSFPSTVEAFNARERAAKIDTVLAELRRAKADAAKIKEELHERESANAGRDAALADDCRIAAEQIRLLADDFKQRHRELITEKRVDEAFRSILADIDQNTGAHEFWARSQRNTAIGCALITVLVVAVVWYFVA